MKYFFFVGVPVLLIPKMSILAKIAEIEAEVFFRELFPNNFWCRLIFLVKTQVIQPKNLLTFIALSYEGFLLFLFFGNVTFAS